MIFREREPSSSNVSALFKLPYILEGRATPDDQPGRRSCLTAGVEPLASCIPAKCHHFYHLATFPLGFEWLIVPFISDVIAVLLSTICRFFSAISSTMLFQLLHSSCLSRGLQTKSFLKAVDRASTETSRTHFDSKQQCFIALVSQVSAQLFILS